MGSALVSPKKAVEVLRKRDLKVLEKTRQKKRKSHMLQDTDLTFGTKKAEKGTRWTEEEHLRFIEAVRKHGKDWVKITE